MNAGWLTIPQAAEKLGVTPSTIRWWFRRATVETFAFADGSTLHRAANGLVGIKHPFPAAGWWEIDPASLAGVKRSPSRWDAARETQGEL